MVYADPLDLYEVRRMGTLPQDGLKTLSRCYLPLIGVEALGVYFALYWDVTIAKKEASTGSHESLYRRTLVTAGVFERSMRALEACGLAKTFREKGAKNDYFVYCLYPPLSAVEFMNSPLLSQTLEKIVGLEAFERLNDTIIKNELPSDMIEETTSFDSFFMPGYENDKTVDHFSDIGTEHNVPIEFSKKAFVAALGGIGLQRDYFTDNELDYCCEMATLYQLDEPTMAGFVFNNFKIECPQGQRVDIRALTRELRKNIRFQYSKKVRESYAGVPAHTQKALLAKLMDELSPLDYLKWRQDGRKPSKKDMDIIQHLYMENGLTGPAINAVVSYVLETNDNVLTLFWCENIACEVKRAGCTTARDTMDYLRTLRAKTKKDVFAPKSKEKAGIDAGFPEEETEKKEPPEKEMSEAEFDALMGQYIDENGNLK